jgi:hypothetical protein
MYSVRWIVKPEGVVLSTHVQVGGDTIKVDIKEIAAL